MRQRAGSIKLDANVVQELVKEFEADIYDKEEAFDETGFRMSDQAAHYDYVHRPYEDKAVRQKKDRDTANKQMCGLRGDP